MLIVENPAMMYSVRAWYFTRGDRQILKSLVLHTRGDRQILKCKWNRISTYSLLRREELWRTHDKQKRNRRISTLFCHEIAGMDRGRKVLDSKQSSLCYLPFDLCSQSVPGECSVDTLIYQEEAMVFFNLLLLLLFDDDGYNSLLLRSHLTLSVSGDRKSVV